MEKKSLIWDCGSSLYDSFELNSFQRQLDSFIVSSRSLSMPHLSHSDHHHHHHHNIKRSSTSSKLFRSLQKLIRSIFRSKSAPGSLFQMKKGRAQEEYNGFSTVPEMAFDSLPRRTVSERFTLSAPLGISFA
ncbi:hypothetical protein NE237_013877 [Protea cynaroides]|uniref:Uncharacterized protein n=1 Tax=Protea cynaroides TaxID=273540 RepID=A0A9Q0JYA8_9MAGN|nr:hypothetical protein NE237_013877 [Protea cynaroides]